jgi:cytochrome c553
MPKLRSTLCRLILVFAGLVSGHALSNQDLTERGAKVAKERCAVCHGIDGRGNGRDVPSLAGQHADYIVKQIFHFKTGQRVNKVMMPVVDELLAVEVRAVAQHYARLEPGSVPEANQGLLVEGRAIYFRGNAITGVSACTHCHGVYGTGGAQMPRLAGQHPAYLESQLRGFIQNDRMMHVSLGAMTDREIAAVSAYLGHDE